jgi:integrase/recombinase XerD
MTRLRKLMLEELQRRNFSEDTIRHYIHTVEDFARRFNRPPDRLGLRHIREYQAHLFQKRKLSSGSVTNHLAALRFFYIPWRGNWFLQRAAHLEPKARSAP